MYVPLLCPVNFELWFKVIVGYCIQSVRYVAPLSVGT